MLGRLTVMIALVAGIATVAVAALAIVTLAPDIVRPTVTQPPIVLPAPSRASAPPVASASPGPPSGSPANAFRVGQPAPQLHLIRVGGGTIDLAALRGKPVWVNFTGTYCASCRDEFPLMNGFAARYASAGLEVVAVDVNEDEATIASFARQLNVTFPIGLDPDGSASQTWGAVVLPVHYWIDAKGVIRDGAYGGIGPDIMAVGLSRIMSGVTVSP